MKFFGSIPSVVMMSLVLLASAQRSSNNLHRDLGKQKLVYVKLIIFQILKPSNVLRYINKWLGDTRKKYLIKNFIRYNLTLPIQTVIQIHSKCNNLAMRS